MHIVLAGFGNMGRALVRGWLGAAAVDAAITVVDPEAAARDAAAALGLTAIESPAGIGGEIDVAVLAVKPDRIESLLEVLPPARLYLSIAAGRKLSGLAEAAGAGSAIVRAMPNTPAAIGLGITGLCANEHVTAEGRKLAASLMSAVGLVEWLDDEGDMDAVTAVSGSGPAYVFLLIECLTSAAIDAGLDPGIAERLATATVRGGGAYAAESEADAATLRRQVTSPNGTTAAALEVLQREDALKVLVRDAVRAAVRRSRELDRGVSGR